MQKYRYQQRFENFEKSFLLLKGSLEINQPSIVEKGGVVQFFEICFELGWKLMKDCLEYNGFNVNSPRDSIKQAFSYGLIEDGALWLSALSDRNLTFHTYDENTADEVYRKIRDEYFILINSLYNKFKELICSD